MSHTALKDAIRNALTEVVDGIELEIGEPKEVEISLDRPAADFGDWSSNIAMMMAKQLGQPPLELANRLAEILNRDHPAHIQKAEVAPPGFLNLFLNNDWLYEELAEVLEQGVENFARHSFGEGQKTIVEFVSANPTGPLHAGHARGAVFGDSLSRVLDRCGFEVSRETYINDLGAQVDLYIQSLQARLDGVEPPQDGYLGEYISEWAAQYRSGDLRQWGLQKALDDQKEVLLALDINLDKWFSESSLSEKLEDVLDQLRQNEMIYEEDGASWLKASSYGDDKDRVLIKSDGTPTYLLPDITYHQDKFNRADKLINVWGADHHGYIARLKIALSALGHKPEQLKIIISQLVHLQSGGQEIKISKRAGELILLKDLLEMVGADVVRFIFLLHSVDSAQTIDLEKAASESMENPVYYVQYAHTRICSIIKKSGEHKNHTADLSQLTHPRELELIRVLSEMPSIVKRAAIDSAPHRLASYLGELAGAFHSFYHDCRVTGEGISPELTLARIQLLKATQVGIVVGLNLCGVSAPTKM